VGTEPGSISHAMDARVATPAADEAVDLCHRRLGAGTGPLGSGPPGSAPRGTTIVGGQSGPRRRGARTAIQALPRQPERHNPSHADGVQWGSSRRSEKEPRSEVAQPVATSVSTPRSELHSDEPRGPGLGRSSAFFRYRNHSSFVDGRDARLVMIRLPSERDQRIPRHASASSAAAAPLEARQGRMQ